MGTVLSVWYLKSPLWAYSLYLRTLRELEISIGVRDMIRNLRRPLFQDYTLQGRIIGLIIRLFRILLGMLLYAGIAVLYLAGYALWLALPILCVVSLVGSFLGGSSE